MERTPPGGDGIPIPCRESTEGSRDNLEGNGSPRSIRGSPFRICGVELSRRRDKTALRRERDLIRGMKPRMCRDQLARCRERKTFLGIRLLGRRQYANLVRQLFHSDRPLRGGSRVLPRFHGAEGAMKTDRSIAAIGRFAYFSILRAASASHMALLKSRI